MQKSFVFIIQQNDEHTDICNSYDKPSEREECHIDILT